MRTTKPRIGWIAPRLRSCVLALVLASCERSSEQDRSEEQRVEMTALPSNVGWMLHFKLPRGSSEPRYRLGSEPNTYPLVDNSIAVPMRREPTTIEISWVDEQGQPRSSTHTLDPGAALADSARRWLEQNPPGWVHLRQVGQNTKLLYLTTLYTHRCGLAKMVYGIDTMTPDIVVEFDECNPLQPAVIPYEAVTYVELPARTEFVSVQLTYLDGNTSRVQRFDTFDRN